MKPKNILYLVFLLVPAIFAWIMASNTFPYLGFDLRHGFLGTKTIKTVETPLFQFSFYLHIVSSLIVWILGFLILLPIFFRKLNFHRLFGKLYVLLLIFIAAPSGMGLSFFANGGLSAKIAFFLQSTIWAFFTLKAWFFIRKNEINLHLRWMIRSLAVTWAAFSLRGESFLMIKYLGTAPIETYLSVVWLSWVGNILLAEILLMFGIDKFFLNFLKISKPR